MKFTKKSQTTIAKDWEALYNAAKAVVNPKRISAQMCSGGVGAAVLSAKGNVYTGVCIDTDCSLAIQMVVAVDKNGQVLPPCGACREFMMQLHNSNEIQVLVDNAGTVVPLSALMPHSYS